MSELLPCTFCDRMIVASEAAITIGHLDGESKSRLIIAHDECLDSTSRLQQASQEELDALGQKLDQVLGEGDD